MPPQLRRELVSLFKAARLDGKSPYVGKLVQPPQQTAVIWAEKTFAYHALKKFSQDALREFLYLEHFERFDRVIVINYFTDPMIEAAVKLGGFAILTLSAAEQARR